MCRPASSRRRRKRPSRSFPDFSLGITQAKVSVVLLALFLVLFETQITKVRAFLSPGKPHRRKKLVIGESRNDDVAFAVDNSVSFADAAISKTKTDTLPPPPNPYNDPTFQSMRKSLPVKLQYWIRDSGLLRWIADNAIWLEIPKLLRTHPKALGTFLQLSGSDGTIPGYLLDQLLPTTKIPSNNRPYKFSRLLYGSQYSRQTIDLIQRRESVTGNQTNQLVVFVHGGAWGSGHPAMYRLVATPFLEQGYDVAILGYPTYPTADVARQIECIKQALEYMTTTTHGVESGSSLLDQYTSISVVGHSSGAHIALSALLDAKWQDELKAKNPTASIAHFVGLAGVYDIPSHYLFERARGVERLSPLAPACGGSLQSWRRFSPSRQLGGGVGAVDLVSDALSESVDFTTWPDSILLVHGTLDSTVPYTSSEKMAKALTSNKVVKYSHRKESNNMKLMILPSVGHSDMILHFFFGGATSDFVLDWLRQGTFLAQ